MFNLSREVPCHACKCLNHWKGTHDPAPTEELFCVFCGAFITTHDTYLRSLIRQDVARLIAEYGSPGRSEDAPKRTVTYIRRLPQNDGGMDGRLTALR